MAFIDEDNTATGAFTIGVAVAFTIGVAVAFTIGVAAVSDVSIMINLITG